MRLTDQQAERIAEKVVQKLRAQGLVATVPGAADLCAGKEVR